MKILIKASWQAWLNGLKYQPQRKQFFKFIGYLIFVVVLSALGNEIFTHLRLSEASPIRVFSVINGFMLFGSAIVAKDLMETSLKVLYQAPDSVLLRSLPIPSVVIFGFKFFEMTVPHFLSILCLLGTPWVAFGLIFQLPWHFYFLLLPACFCFLILIASHVSISMMLITRFFSSGKLLTSLKMLATAISVMVAFFLGLLLLEQRFQSEFEVLKVKQFFFNAVSEIDFDIGTELSSSTWYPHQWLGRLMFSWVDESTTSGLLRWGFWLIGGSLSSVCLAILVAMRIYTTGLENIASMKSVRVWTRAWKFSPRNHSIFSVPRSTFLQRGRAMMRKDFAVFIRHRGAMIAIIMLTFFLIVHIGILLLQNSVADVNDAVAITVQITLYGTLITFRLSCSGFRDEAKTWWMLKSNPITPELAYVSKCLTAFLCAVSYTEFWMLIVLRLLRMPGEVWIRFLLTPILSLSAVCALNTAIGALPWMAELTQFPGSSMQSRPLLRTLTFMFTLLLDIVLIIVPIIVLQIGGVAWLVAVIGCFAAGLGVFYKIGVRNLRKLLVA